MAMKFLSLRDPKDAEEPGVIELLYLIQVKDKQRKEAIKELELKGYDLAPYSRNSYEASRDGKVYRLWQRLCPKCGRSFPLDYFMSHRGHEHLWCAECRLKYPQEADKVRLHVAWQLEKGIDPLAEQRCRACAQLLWPSKVKRGQRTCSSACSEIWKPKVVRHCENCGSRLNKNQKKLCKVCADKAREERALNAPAPRPCANPSCTSGKLVRPPRLYCSRYCVVEHKMTSGFYSQISERGMEAIHTYKQVRGEIPEYTSRVETVIRNNKERPPRLKIEREGKVWGKEARFVPALQGGVKGYEGYVLDFSHIKVWAKTKKGCAALLRAALREQRVSLEQEEPNA